MVRAYFDRLGERHRLAVVGQLARLLAGRRDLGGQLLDAGDAGLPETAWYVDAISRTSPASSCSGLSTGIAAIVVQFGLAMIPLRASAIASGLTSETTSGTSGSIRNAEELSTTIDPASANRRGQRPRGGGPGGEQRDVQPARVGGRGVLDGDLAAGVGQHGAGRAGGGEEPHLVGGELPLGEDLAHGDAHLPGGADDSDPEAHAHRPVPP